MHYIFTIFVLIWAAGRGEQMRVFQYRVRQTAAVNAHTQEYKHKKTSPQTQDTLTATYTLCTHCALTRGCLHTHLHTIQKRVGRVFVFMWEQSCPYWREYDMGMCNYMTNVVMIWCLNISTDLCRAGTPAIHPRKAATRDAWVCASNTWARCPARNIHDRLIAQGPREDGTIEKVLKIHHKSYAGKRWMDQEGKLSPTTLEIKTTRKKKSFIGFSFCLNSLLG